MDTHAFGRRVSARREEIGMTMEQLSLALGVHPQLVCVWEAGALLPDIPTAEALARVLGVSLDQLLAHTNPKQKALGLYCSFCSKHCSEVKEIVAGPGVYICDQCVQTCSNIISHGGSWPQP